MAMRTFGDLVYPSAVRNAALVRDGLLVLSGSLLVAICAKIQVPAAPVPVTMQTFAVLLVGAALGGKRGGLALVAYLLEGAAGLPVFAGPVAGAAYLVGPTGGYLFAFPLAAFVVGTLAERGWDRRLGTALLAMAIGMLMILTVGATWLAVFLGMSEAFRVGLVAFLPAGFLKVLLAAIALPVAWRGVQRLERGSVEP